MKEITVIMGIYNCGSTLDKAIESLINQSVDNWSLIMCDDCSSDETLKIAKAYEKKYDNIKVIQNASNQGLAFSLNQCLEYVDTKYVARMDGDDVSHPDRFIKQYQFLESNEDFALVSSPMFLFDQNGRFGQTNLIENPRPIHFIFGTPHSHAPAMIRTKVLREVNGYNSSILRAQDYDLWSRIYALGYRGKNLSEPLYSMLDDRDAVSRRSVRVRLAEVALRYKIFKRLNLPFWAMPYVLKPCVQMLIPKSLYATLRNRKYKAQG